MASAGTVSCTDDPVMTPTFFFPLPLDSVILLATMDPHDATHHREQVEEFRHRTGLVTLVFTDIVESTQLKQSLGDHAGATLIQQHRTLVRELLGQFPESSEIETAGDSFLLVFSKPSAAVTFALLLLHWQKKLAEKAGHPLPLRIGIHLGEVVIEDHEAGHKPKDLYGIAIDTCARIMSLAKVNQALMSRGVFDNARQLLKGDDIEGIGPLEWLNHGPYLLKGIEEPVDVCEVREVGSDTGGPPTSSEKAKRQVRADEEPVLGWRPAVGQQVGHTDWVLEEKLGEGGFGEVWVGRHRKLKERRVFKFCFRADRVRSLKREMTLFRVIKERIGDHPNIVALREVYFEEPPYFLEEDYVEGRDLMRWCEVQGGVSAVPLETRLEIVAQVADALQAAHECGVIHRDVKPGNILVSGQWSVASGQSDLPPAHRLSSLSVKLTDFGIGQVVSEDYLAGVTRAGFTETMSSTSSSHTGTQLYLAPELLAGEPATTRSDLYSLGVVLYQLLVGAFNRPLTSDWAEDVTDPLLRDDVRHCVAGKPADRFAGAGQLAANLRTYRQRQEELERCEAEKAALERAAYRRGMMRTVGVAAIVVAVIAGLALLALNESRRAKKGEQRAAAGELAARKNLYAADMSLAYRAWQENNLGVALELLNKHRTVVGQPDLRGWEWRYLWGACQSEELYSLTTFPYGVVEVAISPDGKLLAAAGNYFLGQGEVTLWDLALKKLIATPEPKDAGGSAVFSPDGKLLAFGTAHQGIKLWDITGHREIRRFPGKHVAWPLLGLAFSPDGRTLAAYQEAGKIGLWNLEDNTLRRTLAGPSAGTSSLAFLDAGRCLASASWDRTIRLWSVATGEQLHCFTNHTGQVQRVVPSPDGRILASADMNDTIRIWDLRNRRLLKALTNHTFWVSSLAFSPGGKMLASGSADHTIKLWDTTSWEEVSTLRGSLHEIWSLAFSPDGRALFSGSKDGAIKVWDAEPKVRKLQVLRRPEDANKFEILGCSGMPVAWHEDTTFSLWEPGTLRKLGRYAKPPAELGADAGIVALSKNGDRLAWAGRQGAIVVWDTPGARQLASLPWIRPEEATSVPPESLEARSFSAGALSPDGTRLCFVAPNRLSVWNLKTLDEFATLPKSSAAPLVETLCFANDNDSLAVGSEDCTVEVWNLARKERIGPWKAHRETIRAVAFMPDGKRLLTASQDSTIKLWNIESRQEVRTFGRTANGYFSVAVSPDGLRVVGGVGGSDICIRIWNAEDGQEVALLKGLPPAAVRHLAFLEDGNTLVSCSTAEVRLWRAPSWAEIEAIEKGKAKAP
jgi:WD40 repeat protein/class 3 adenylate cyclase